MVFIHPLPTYLTEERFLATPKALAAQVARWRTKGLSIVFTNGCFDILHPGHVSYLEAAALLGDILLVGLNDDASVTRLKGEGRPITPLKARARVLAGLQSVRGVTPFSDDTPLALIQAVKPDVLVKGGDYSADAIVGAQDVTGWGGRVEVLPFVAGYSTSAIVNQLQGNQ